MILMEQEADMFKRAIKNRNWEQAKMVWCAFHALNNSSVPPATLSLHLFQLPWESRM